MFRAQHKNIKPSRLALVREVLRDPRVAACVIPTLAIVVSLSLIVCLVAYPHGYIANQGPRSASYVQWDLDLVGPGDVRMLEHLKTVPGVINVCLKEQGTPRKIWREHYVVFDYDLMPSPPEDQSQICVSPLPDGAQQLSASFSLSSGIEDKTAADKAFSYRFQSRAGTGEATAIIHLPLNAAAAESVGVEAKIINSFGKSAPSSSRVQMDRRTGDDGRIEIVFFLANGLASDEALDVTLSWKLEKDN